MSDILSHAGANNPEVFLAVASDRTEGQIKKLGQELDGATDGWSKRQVWEGVFARFLLPQQNASNWVLYKVQKYFCLVALEAGKLKNTMTVSV